MPGPIICPLCTQARTVTATSALDDRDRPILLLRCDDASHDVLRWEMADMAARRALRRRTRRPSRSLVQRMGLYDKLRAVLARFDGWVEHGVVEHAFAQDNPDEYAELVARMGHVAVDGAASSSASGYLSRMLGNLTRSDEVEHRRVEATGQWSYNRDISAWKRADAGSDELLSWEDFATANGIDPDSWPATANL